jgi:hypothetical protein
VKRFSLPFGAALLFVINGFSAASAQDYNVLTQHNDIYRSGVYSGETILHPTNVNAKSFGKIFARRVLGQIWGQPLYVRGVPVNGQLHNVVYVATSENWVYGFDADDRTPDEQTKPLKQVFFGAPVSISQGFPTIWPSNGISSTPAIDLGSPPDPSKGTLYVVAKLSQDNKFHIFGLDLSTLTIRPNAQGQSTGVIVGGAAPGQNKRGSTTIYFDEDKDHLNRPALLISENHLVIAFGSGPGDESDGPVYHGWVMSYSLPDLVQTGIFVTTPTTDTAMGAIWQAGNGPAADDQGNVYVMTGNGHFQSTKGLLPDLADSFVKLENKDGKLPLVDWYTPRSRDVLEACDLDLGASGPAIIQDSGKVLGAGKSGILYVLDKDSMGRDPPFDLPKEAGAWNGTPDCKVGQCFRVAENVHGQPDSKQACNMIGFPFQGNGWNNSNWNDVLNSYPHVHGSPVVWKMGSKNFNLYVWPEEDYLKAYHFDGRTFLETPVGSSAPLNAAMMSMPGGILSLSWDGTNTNSGVIWASRPNPNLQDLVGGPFVDTFAGLNQQHFAYRDKDGAIWDSWYNDDNQSWNLQKINLCAAPCNAENGLTTGPQAVTGPFVNTFVGLAQQHFAYRDKDGVVWDSWYNNHNQSWNLQQINLKRNNRNAVTDGNAAVDGPFGNTFVGLAQQHFAYRDKDGVIWDSWYNDQNQSWNLQQINLKRNNPNAVTAGPQAVAGPFVDTFAGLNQQHFAYRDKDGAIWDSWYNDHNQSWNLQQINLKRNNRNAVTDGNAAVAGPFVNTFVGLAQQHFAYRDKDGVIWDSWYNDHNQSWNLQQINLGGVTAGPQAVAGPFVDTFAGLNQQHFAYRDKDGAIWDSWYNDDNQSWNLQKINFCAAPCNAENGLTTGPQAVTGPFVNTFVGLAQQHFAYRDKDGVIWDSWYNNHNQSWNLQQINTSYCMYSPADHQDLTPNAAPCNAINKIVHGYLQAFDATPGLRGHLTELWNSEDNPNDRVEWFAKDSPPTIADGKVFVAEFPAKPSNSDWNANNAFGRLIMYGLRGD